MAQPWPAANHVTSEYSLTSPELRVDNSLNTKYCIHLVSPIRHLTNFLVKTLPHSYRASHIFFNETGITVATSCSSQYLLKINLKLKYNLN